jgi:hypothetical protein
MILSVCDLKTALEWVSTLAAFGAAGFWFYASWIGRGSFLNTPMAHLDRSMTLQARYNAAAAFCAGVSALLHLATLQMPVCRAFS